MKWRNDEHVDAGVEADLAELGEWGPDLLALREEPRPEFLLELDKRLQPDFSRGRADEQIAAAEQPPRRRLRLLPTLGVAVPALGAVVVAVVLVSSGSSNDTGPDKLPVAVSSGGPRAPADSGTPAPQGSSALDRAGGPAAPAVSLASSQIAAGEPVVLRYTAPRPRSVFVSLSPTDGGSATATRQVRLPAGSGRLRIATDDLTAGRYALVVSLTTGQSALRATIQVLD